MADRPVLELRIHGINNTQPEDMLDLSKDDIEKVAGDALGSFWQPKSPAPDATTRLEAYSWGGMARSSVGGKAGIGRIVGGLARIGWALLIPFGLVNVAYWSRKFDDGPTTGKRSHRDGLQHGRGAASLRIAGLMLTLLMAVSASTITLDLVAVQCYTADSNQLMCTALPSQLGFLETMTQTRRLAVLSLVPVVLIVGLALLSAATRVRYEQPDPATRKEPSIEGEAATTPAEAAKITTEELKWPVLATDGFWAHRGITKVTSRMHVAATATLVAGGTAFHVAFGRGTSCGDRKQFFSSACWAEVSSGDCNVIAELVVAALGIVILLLALAIVALRSDYAGDVALQSQWDNKYLNWGVPAASAALFIAQTVLLCWNQKQPHARQLLGVSFTPTWLLAVLLGFGLAALLWRPSINTNWWWLPAVLGLVFVALVMASGYSNTIQGWWAEWILAAAGVMAVLLWRRHTTAEKSEAWSGGGPGVLLLVAIAFAMLLSSAVVTATGDWLNGDRSAAELANGVSNDVPTLHPCPYNCITVVYPDLQVPLPYIWSGASLLPVILGMFGVGTYAFFRSRQWQNPPDGGQPMTDNTIRLAAVAQRAEKFVAALAILSTVAMTATLTASVRGFLPEDAKWHCLDLTTFLEWTLTIGMWALAGTGVLVIGLAVGGAVTGGGRPLGLVWDLICFLPRTGHPLAPPCYAERVVPELARRCEVWFTGKKGDEQSDDDGATEKGEKAVLSAHSLGSVLAVAVVLSPRLGNDQLDNDHKYHHHMALLSYGSQLRPYFGRIFPELLGPEVLGIPRCRSSRLRTPDPWADERESPLDSPGLADPDSRSVRGRLDPSSLRWRSLWRRTDYLGFPVWRYPPDENAPNDDAPNDNPIDRRADQVIPVGYLYEIQTHGGYPLTNQYRDALAELIEVTPAASSGGKAPEQPA